MSLREDITKVERAFFKAWNAERLNAIADTAPDSETARHLASQIDPVKARRSAERSLTSFVKKWGQAEADRAHLLTLRGDVKNPFPLFAALGALGARNNPSKKIDRANRAIKRWGKYRLELAQAKRRKAPIAEIERLERLEHKASRDANESIPRSNPEPVTNHAPIPKLALLGTVEEIVIQSHARRSTLRPRGAVLLVSADARTIVIARPSSSEACALPKDSRPARRMFEKWSQFKCDRAVRIALADKPLTVDLGSAQVIRYRSDKWSGKPTLYEHVFSGKTTAIADSYRAPHTIRIDGDPPRVLVTERGIVG